jgi:hypothetical protein
MSRLLTAVARLRGWAASVAVPVLLAGSAAPGGAQTPPQSSITFGVVGDFGSGGWGGPRADPIVYHLVGRAAAGVASRLTQQIGPASGTFIISLGDQIYQPWLPDVQPVGGAPSISLVENLAASPSDYSNAIGALYGAYIDFSNVPVWYRIPGMQGSSGGMRFFPAAGDHDWWKQRTRTSTSTGTTYQMPGNDNYESYYSGLSSAVGNPACPQSTIRYYCVAQGGTPAAPLVQFYALSNDPNEAMLGTLATASTEPGAWTQNMSSSQIQWFVQGLKSSTATWNVAFMHQPPFTTSSRAGHSASTFFQVFDSASALAGKPVDLVLAGHVHSYERLQNTVPGSSIAYIVNGAGGTFESFAQFCSQAPGGANCSGPTQVSGSQVQVYGFYGFQVVTATAGYLNLRFYGSADPGGVLAASYPEALRNDAPGQWLLLDNFFILKAGASVPYGTVESATGVLVQSGAATITGVTGYQAIAGNVYGPGSLNWTGGGTLTFTGAVMPPAVASAISADSANASVLAAVPYAWYAPPAAGQQRSLAPASR